MTDRFDPLTFGKRLRHRRRAAGLTLRQLGDRVGHQAPYLSMLEGGLREPRLSLVDALADALATTAADLLRSEAPDHRSRLEIGLERAQQDPVYGDLGLPHLKATATLPDAAIEHLLALYGELKRARAPVNPGVEEARRANASLRAEMRGRDNYFEEIERAAAEALGAVHHPGSGAVPESTLLDLAGHFGFTIRRVQDVPPSTRSITDLENRRIYIGQRDALRTREARSVVVQTLGHFALGHAEPTHFADFLRQRVEANYFAGAVLVPEPGAVATMLSAKRARDLSVEDLKELFYVSYEMAAHRFTNLATRHLEIPVHFVRSDPDGLIWKAYENNAVPFPVAADGGIEGERLCREWGTRRAFGSIDRYAIHYQYTDTAAGTFWCGTHLEADRDPSHAITVGVRFEEARHFRGRDTDRHSVSRCPGGDCCRAPRADLASRWDGMAYPAPAAHSHVPAAMPGGTFPGVDLVEVYEFLDRHAT